VAVLRAALRDLQWRWKRFVIAVVGVALVFAMGLIMTGLSESFSLEVDRTLDAIGADAWAVSVDASGPFTSFVPMLSSAGGTDASPVMVLRQTIADGATFADIIIIAVEPGRLGSPRPTRGDDLAGGGEAVVDDALGIVGLGETFSVGGAVFRVVGTVSGQRLYAGLPVVYIPLADAQSMAVRGQPVATAFLYPAPPSNVASGLRTMSNDDVKADVLRPLMDARSSIAFVRLLLWLVAATIIGSLLYLQATERTRDFAVFKATGTSTLGIGAGLVLQAVVLSLAAAALAALLATVLAPLFPMPVEIPMSAFRVLPVVTVSVGLLASLVALRRTATVQPALAFGG
jgi:putative ABC transport system permease protein